MTNFRTIRPDSDEFDDAIRGYVLANRINDVVARPSSKRYRKYMSIVQDGFCHEPVIDPSALYRDEAKALVPNALMAYERRHGVRVDTDRVYFHGDPDIRIAAIPDAIESDYFGITVHVRQSHETYDEAVAAKVTPPMERHAVAMMLITGIRYWLHLDYLEIPEIRLRRLYEHPVQYNESFADSLEAAMIGFLLKTRRRAAA